MKKCIIYYTNNKVPEDIGKACINTLKSSELDIISVSQKPMELGQNICVYEQPKSIHSIYWQILTGLNNSDADIVYLAEHDCLYASTHWKFIPYQDDTFYYNTYVWYLNWMPGYRRGTFTKTSPGRKALSQLVCYRELLIESLEGRLEFLVNGGKFDRGVKGAHEPGAMDVYESREFVTSWPNVDVRHRRNFSGARRGKEPTKTIQYWGTLEDIESKWT